MEHELEEDNSWETSDAFRIKHEPLEVIWIYKKQLLEIKFPKTL